MTVRAAHGTGAAAVVRVETPPVDELRPGPGPDGPVPIERRPDGTLTPAGARVLGRRGGKASQKRRRLAAELAEQLGLADVPEQLAPYIDHAKAFASAQMASLADQFGDVGPGPSSMVQSSALALAASRAAYAAGDVKTGARLAADSRQQLLTAHHLADLESKAAQQRHDAPMDLAAALGAPAAKLNGGRGR